MASTVSHALELNLIPPQNLSLFVLLLAGCANLALFGAGLILANPYVWWAVHVTNAVFVCSMHCSHLHLFACQAVQIKDVIMLVQSGTELCPEVVMFCLAASI